MNPERRPLGAVTAGSLTKGIDIRLDSTASVEELAVGQYVTIDGAKQRFFGMLTDISLETSDPALAQSPPDSLGAFAREVLTGSSAYGSLHILPTLTLGSGAAETPAGPMPVKTVPSHFSTAYLATQQDIELVFGGEDARKFYIGTPLDMETKVCLDLEKLVTRSNGVFGKSGTGKTFLTRLLLIGMIQKSAAVNLVFDMHSEYGWAGGSESHHPVKALKQLFPSKVAVFALDEENARRRKVSTDFVVRIGYDEIEAEDIALLRSTLNLTEPAVEAVYQLSKRFGADSISRTLALESGESEDTAGLLESLGIHEGTYQNLRRGLATIGRLQFLVPHAAESAVAAILDYLERGTNVVLEFGRYTDITAYVLVANLLSRRIYDRYRERTERALGEQGNEPRPLVITIEEAHKFLNPEAASQTIFGTIAREMRKYNVTLLVIDQRPSGIDEEVMSQLGTKLSCLLDNERDIESVLAGVPGKTELKSVLARLESKQQALIFGHAVPMPVVVRTREYGSAGSYDAFRDESPVQAKKDIEELWG